MAKTDETTNVVVLGFESMDGAENMLANVQTWEEKGFFNVKDAVVVTRGAGTNDVEIKQTVKKAGKWSLGGGGMGLLAGFLLGGPVGGLVAGATIGAISGAMKDFGIPDKQIRAISESLPAQSSALFLMTIPVEGRDDEALYEELRPYKAKLISTTLPEETAKRLEQLLTDEE